VIAGAALVCGAEFGCYEALVSRLPNETVQIGGMQMLWRILRPEAVYGAIAAGTAAHPIVG